MVAGLDQENVKPVAGCMHEFASMRGVQARGCQPGQVRLRGVPLVQSSLPDTRGTGAVGTGLRLGEEERTLHTRHHIVGMFF